MDKIYAALLRDTTRDHRVDAGEAVGWAAGVDVVDDAVAAGAAPRPMRDQGVLDVRAGAAAAAATAVSAADVGTERC